VSPRLPTLEDLGEVSGKRVFVRVDFNVPLEEGRVADDLRVRAAVPTLNELLEKDAALVLASHLGRPKGQVRGDLRMAPVASTLAGDLGRQVVSVQDVVGDEATGACSRLEPGDVVMLENLRFDPGEEGNDEGFARRLAALADVYVDDAFGAAHRAHASVDALPRLLGARGAPTAAGRLLQREVEVLSRLLEGPDEPYVAVLGGAKVSDKLGVIEGLLERVDALLIGGAMAFTFLAADGLEVGRSLVEEDRLDDVREAQRHAKDQGVLIQLPEDVVVAPEASVDAPRRTVRVDAIPRDAMGLDIGPRSVEEFARTLADARTILWNGPMGVFELEPFSAGTRGVAHAVAGASAFTVIGGGDSLLAVKRLGLEREFDHMSTGGGASLEFLEGKTLPGIAALEEG
jgi:phosphoglycerate kinase